MSRSKNESRKVLRAKVQEMIGPFGNVRPVPDAEHGRLSFKLVCQICARTPGLMPRDRFRGTFPSIEVTVSEWHSHLEAAHPGRYGQ